MTDELNPFEEEMRKLLEQLAKLGGNIDPLRQWFKDRGLSLTLSDKQARFLVDDYYIIQENRKRSANQSKALTKAGEPDAVVQWLCTQNERLENIIKFALASYVKRHKMGAWLTNVYGIGPVLAAGLLAHIDIKKAPTVGHIWQFFGIAGAGQHAWLPSTIRPWNAMGKTLTYKIGDSFIKFSNRPECYYGAIYRTRKSIEIAKNDAGDFTEQATREAPKKDKNTVAWPWNAGCYPAGTTKLALEVERREREEYLRTHPGKSSDAREHSQECLNQYLKSVRGEPGSGLAMLHLGHINDRARRYAVKQFLADLHGAWYRCEFGREPPLPYPVAHLGHAHVRNAAE